MLRLSRNGRSPFRVLKQFCFRTTFCTTTTVEMEEARTYPIICFIMLCDSRQIRNADSPFRALYCQPYSTQGRKGAQRTYAMQNKSTKEVYYESGIDYHDREVEEPGEKDCKAEGKG